MSNFQTSVKIIRESEPVNLECPFHEIDSQLTPTESFYVRNHFAQPTIDIPTWRLSIEGEVTQPFQISYDELLSMPLRTVSAVLECAGNSRVFLTPKVNGAQWGLGAVGNAEWTGVPLSLVLERAGLRDSVIEIIFEGSDKGIPEEKPKPKSAIHYARSLPKQKALLDEVILAYHMNGEPLSQAHGFPVRLIVPGWYGMASVKWLKRIVAVDAQFDGYFQKIDYAYWIDKNGLPVRQTISEIEVKSEIAQPASHDSVSSNSLYKVKGAAWSGEQIISKVELSVDGGESWRETKLEAEPKKFSWVLWSFDWDVGEKLGSSTLMSRATDSSGMSQPLERDPEKDTYRISHVLKIPVRIV